MLSDFEPDKRYGPLLDDLINLQKHSWPQVPNPSRNEIRQAIYSLSDPESVTYMTFATILAMERTPACNHLALLASDACIFPACIKLLRKYCHVERKGLFDHAYGLLCFQTIVLSTQVAILLQTEQLDSVLTTMANQPPDSSVFPLLCGRILQAEMNARFGPRRRGTTWLLGWYDDELVGRQWKSCLKQTGGFTIHDAKFLVEQTWSARADFLTVATVAEKRYYGWGSFLHLVCTILSYNYGIESNRMGEAPVPQTFDQRQCWIHFVDIGIRYALFSSEAEDALMPAFLENTPNYSKPWKVAGTRSTLGALDSNRITQAFLTKLQGTTTTIP
ncbi:unnamed protein product [Rhizoctonia solani]|nr:unnamed protein product [Rhizoctonia solani]